MRSKAEILLIVVTLLFVAVPALWAQQSWEGSAIVGRYGEFPPGGLYAASNAFPLNSVIEVTNPDTGRTQRLIVAQRAEASGVLLVVSQSAAEELGVSRGATFRVQVEPVEMPPLTSVPPNEDLPFHPDPDINPRAAVTDPNAALLQPGVPEAAAEEPTEEAPPAPSIAEGAAEEPAEESAEGPEAEETAPEEPPVEEPAEPEAVAEALEETPEEAPEEAPEPGSDGETDAGPTPPAVAVVPGPDAPETAPEGRAEEEPPMVAEEPEGPGEKDLFPPAPEEELYAALATPERPEEDAAVTELPIAPVEGATVVDADSLGTRFANPVELTVTLPEPLGVETPEAADLAPPRPEERAPAGELAMASPGESVGPDMSEELAERPERPEGPVTEIPLRIVEEIEPPRAEEERISRPTGKPGEEIVSLEPAEYRPPDPPEPEEEEPLTPDERPEARVEEPRVSQVPEPPEEAASEEPPRPAERPVEEPAPTVAAEPRSAPAEELPLISDLSEEGYYLQVGAFSDPQGAQAAVNRLGGEFPVKVVPSDGEIYRVFVGPLEEDERGAVLYLVRARGYRDAFLRSSSDG